MSYVIVTGGREAIRQAEMLTKYYRIRNSKHGFDHCLIQDNLTLLVDRIMSEGGLYAPEYAALALKQAEGDPYEATFLLRSYRSTLEHAGCTLTINTDEMRIIRRISAAFKDIPGGQILGPTRDYTHHLLDFSLRNETAEKISAFTREFLNSVTCQETTESFDRVTKKMRQDGLVSTPEIVSEEDPFDITRQNMPIPAPRSARLQALSRGETGVMMALAYSYGRSFGANTHPMIAELRSGYVSVFIPHPYDETENGLYIGEILLTEVEMINTLDTGKAHGESPSFGLSYGLCFGRNEQKAISMAMLEYCMGLSGKSPAEDEEFVLRHIDSLDSGGIINHYNLPHYVSFNATVEHAQRIKNAVKVEKATIREGKDE